MSKSSQDRTYRPRGFYQTLRLPFETDLSVGASVGLRPSPRPVTGHLARSGFRLKVRGVSVEAHVGRSRHHYRLAADGRARVEAAINSALPPAQQVLFDRDPDGLIRGWGAVPVQAEGRIGDHRFYFRFRHNCAHLDVQEPGSDADSRVVLTTAAAYDVYDTDTHPGAIYAGSFDTDTDMVRVFVDLVQRQQWVDVRENPTHVQSMLTAILATRLARLPRTPEGGRDFAAERAVLEKEKDGDVSRVVRERWSSDPEVADWLAAQP